MILLTGDDHEDGDQDYGQCPHCRVWIGKLLDEVDFENSDLDRCTTPIRCPGCGERIALVVTFSYDLLKYAKRKD